MHLACSILGHVIWGDFGEFRGILKDFGRFRKRISTRTKANRPYRFHTRVTCGQVTLCGVALSSHMGKIPQNPCWFAIAWHPALAVEFVSWSGWGQLHRLAFCFINLPCVWVIITTSSENTVKLLVLMNRTNLNKIKKILQKKKDNFIFV